MRQPAASADTPRTATRPARLPPDYSQRMDWGALRMRMRLAGTPPSTELAGKSLVTTALVPTMLIALCGTPLDSSAATACAAWS